MKLAVPTFFLKTALNEVFIVFSIPKSMVHRVERTGMAFGSKKVAIGWAKRFLAIFKPRIARIGYLAQHQSGCRGLASARVQGLQPTSIRFSATERAISARGSKSRPEGKDVVPGVERAGWSIDGTSLCRVGSGKTPWKLTPAANLGKLPVLALADDRDWCAPVRWTIRLVQIHAHEPRPVHSGRLRL